jgi:hypothetical protein
MGQLERARASLEAGAAAARASCPTYCGPWALAAQALGSADDEPLARGLLEEGGRLLQRGCVSHNYLEYHHYAMELMGQWRDWDGVRVHADALEAYTRDEPLPWADVILAAHRAIAHAALDPGPQSARAARAALQSARERRFLVLAALLEKALPAGAEA